MSALWLSPVIYKIKLLCTHTSVHIRIVCCLYRACFSLHVSCITAILYLLIQLLQSHEFNGTAHSNVPLHAYSHLKVPAAFNIANVSLKKMPAGHSKLILCSSILLCIHVPNYLPDIKLKLVHINNDNIT